MVNEELVIKRDGKIVKYKSMKIVKKIGNTGHIVLPKLLVGKKVNVSYGLNPIK